MTERKRERERASQGEREGEKDKGNKDSVMVIDVIVFEWFNIVNKNLN